MCNTIKLPGFDLMISSPVFFTLLAFYFAVTYSYNELQIEIGVFSPTD